jgi:hypothetical protein
MSFGVTLFGPKHYLWRNFKGRNSCARVWFYRPDESSTGGTGFCLPGLHVVFTWGR